jgi:hypothetical protein
MFDHKYVIDKMRNHLRKNEIDEVIRLWNGDKESHYLDGIWVTVPDPLIAESIACELAYFIEHNQEYLSKLYDNLFIAPWMLRGYTKKLPLPVEKDAMQKHIIGLMKDILGIEDITITFNDCLEDRYHIIGDVKRKRRRVMPSTFLITDRMRSEIYHHMRLLCYRNLGDPLETDCPILLGREGKGWVYNKNIRTMSLALIFSTHKARLF